MQAKKEKPRILQWSITGRQLLSASNVLAPSEPPFPLPFSSDMAQTQTASVVPARPTSGSYVLTLTKKVNAESLKDRYQHQNPDPTEAELDALKEPNVWNIRIGDRGEAVLTQGKRKLDGSQLSTQPGVFILVGGARFRWHENGSADLCVYAPNPGSVNQKICFYFVGHLSMA